MVLQCARSFAIAQDDGYVSFIVMCATPHGHCEGVACGNLWFCLGQRSPRYARDDGRKNRKGTQERGHTCKSAGMSPLYYVEDFDPFLVFVGDIPQPQRNSYKEVCPLSNIKRCVPVPIDDVF